MKKIYRSFIESRIVSWIALFVIILWIVMQLHTPDPWWTYLSIFLAFMMVFCHLAALYLYAVSWRASRKLDSLAMLCGILFVIALVATYIASQVSIAA